MNGHRGDPFPLVAVPKERIGKYRLEQKARRVTLKTAEDKHKRQAKARDGNVCRAPHASQQEYDECRQLRIEVAHLTHKGMGSDPSGERSLPELLVALGLRCHRDRLDRKRLRAKFLTVDRANGPIAWEEQHGERWILSHVEKRIGDANEKWRRGRR